MQSQVRQILIGLGLVSLAAQAAIPLCAQTAHSHPTALDAPLAGAHHGFGPAADVQLTVRPALQRLPPADGQQQARRSEFPPLPPDPLQADQVPLPPLELELWHHGGSYLYQAEGDRWNWPEDSHTHPDGLLRLPEDWQKPEPWTWFAEFLGADPVQSSPYLRWPGPAGYAWEPRFVGYGAYQLFALAFQQSQLRRDAVGHQLLLDLDLRLTGTERFHMQLRPIGRRNTGGSYYQFNDAVGYVDNSTISPASYWFEGELQSILGSYLNPFRARDYHVVVGKFPFLLHNALLMNDEIIGVAINKNTIYLGGLSNLNVQVFYAFEHVDTFADSDSELYGVHFSADRHHAFYELTYALVDSDVASCRDTHFAAISRTQLYGPLTLAGRAMFKWGDRCGPGSGELVVLESNYTRLFDSQPLAVEYGVFYCNAFFATQGWNSIAGGNFNRLRTAFESNPLVRVAALGARQKTLGAALGVQLFRHHEDESFIPEVALESVAGELVWGVGLRYLRKTGRRTYLEALGVFNFSNDPQLERDGVFVSYNVLF